MGFLPKNSGGAAVLAEVRRAGEGGRSLGVLRPGGGLAVHRYQSLFNQGLYLASGAEAGVGQKLIQPYPAQREAPFVSGSSLPESRANSRAAAAQAKQIQNTVRLPAAS